MTLITNDHMRSVLTHLENCDEVALDTETTGLNVRNGVDYLMGICLAGGGKRGYIPVRHRSGNVDFHWLKPFFNILRHKPVSWHNRKFDWHSIRTLGSEFDPCELFQGPQYDTLIISHMVNEELYSHSLNSVAKRYINDEKADSDEVHKLGEIYGWGAIPPEVMAPYGEYDADITLRLKNALWPLLVEQGLEEVYWKTEAPFTSLLYRMEQRGVGVNTELAAQKAERGHGRMSSIKRELKLNPASPVELGKYLLDELQLPVLATTPKGKPSFNKVAMEGYDEILQAMDNPAAKRIAEFRGWQKATSSLYEPLLQKVGPDGRIRTEFKQHGTVTGRLSASDPNLQQVPRGSDKPWNGDAKRCFTSGEDGYSLYGWDYSQVELRLAAAYGRESILLTEFEKPDADPFNVLAPIIFGTLTNDTRQWTKTFVYANLYGAGLPKIAATLGRSVEETRPLFERYRKSIPGIIHVGQQVYNVMRSQGYVSYWDGRRRHIRNHEERHKAWNSLIQGGAAQITKNAMLRADREVCDNECQIVLTVHDEITFTLPTESIPDYEPGIVKAMVDWPDFPVTFAADGKAWS